MADQRARFDATKLLDDMVQRGERARVTTIRKLEQPDRTARHVAQTWAAIAVLEGRLDDLRRRLAALEDQQA